MAGNYQLSVYAQVADVVAGPIGGSNAASGQIKYQAGGSVTTNPYAGTHALSGGLVTLTLSTLTAIGGGALNLTGAVIKHIVVENLGANVMTFAMGATNGFPIPTFGVGPLGISVISVPGVAGFGTVAAGDNTIDVSGTGTQSFKIILITEAA